LPKSFAEKKEFKAFIKTREMESGKELNFDEAVANSAELFKPTALPDSVK